MPQEPSTAKRPSSRWRTWRSFFLKLACSCVFTFALLEIGLRLAGIRPIPAHEERLDPRNLHPIEFIARAQREGWLPWPREVRRTDPVQEHPRGVVEIRRNDCSFREDEDTPIEKPAGTFRIVILGDSHTDGVVFNDESFANRLETSLNRSATKTNAGTTKYDVINAGFGRSSPYQQLWAYERVLSQFHPDHVIVCFYAGNDLTDLLRKDDRVHLDWDGQRLVHAAATHKQDTTTTSFGMWERFRSVLRNNLATYHAATRVTFLRRAVRVAASDSYRDRLELAADRHPGPVWQGLNQAYFFREHPEQWNDVSRMMRHILARFQELTQRDEIGLSLVIIPTLRQIHPQSDQAALNAAIRTLGLAEDDLDCDDRACDLAASLAAELKIPLIDLREPFRSAVAESPDLWLFYRFDHHLNLEGHRLTAELLEKFLADRLSIAE